MRRIQKPWFFSIPIVLNALLLWALPCASAVCTKPILYEAPIRHTTGPDPLVLETGDFNEDGIPDVAVVNGGNGTVAVLIGTGPRTFASPISYVVGGGPLGVVSGDFNEDGIADLAVSNRSSNSLSILLGNGAGGVGNGSFAPAVHYPTGPASAPFQLITDDFDEDGILDLAASQNGTPGIVALRGLGSGGVGNGTFGSPLVFPISNISTAIERGDFNRDGNLDLVATENYDGTIAVLLGTGSPALGNDSFAPAVHYSAGVEPFDIAVADFNEDGNPDLAVGSSQNAGTAIMLGPGNGTFGSFSVIPSANNIVVVPDDVNQDGILDLVLGCNNGQDSGTIRTFIGGGSGGVGDGTFGGQQIYSLGSDPYHIEVGDFDGDGFRDLLVSSFFRNFISLMPGTCSDVPLDPRSPFLTDVRDVPNDQGGRVFLTWNASSLDAPGGSVLNYRVWRRIPAETTVETASSPERFTTTLAQGPEGATTIFWEALATLPAQRLPGYGYTAATTQDSMRNGNPYTAFFVSALTSNIDVFHSSNVDSGYSVDNLRPRRPESFEGKVGESGYLLSWEESSEPDLDAYRLHRGTEEGFAPSDANRIATLTELEFIDSDGTGAEYYKLSAVDSHGNESEHAILHPSTPTGIGGTDFGFALRGVRPNPSPTGEITVDLILVKDVPARLEIVDLAGRRIASHDLYGLHGAQSIKLAGRERLRPGVYLIRLLQGANAREVKAIVAP